MGMASWFLYAHYLILDIFAFPIVSKLARDLARGFRGALDVPAFCVSSIIFDVDATLRLAGLQCKNNGPPSLTMSIYL